MVAISEIPLLKTTSTFEQNIVLDGITYVLRCRFNTRSRYWYMTILDTDNNILAAGRKMAVDRPLLQRDTSELLPPGALWLRDTEGTGADAGLRDLGDRHHLLYVEAE